MKTEKLEDFAKYLIAGTDMPGFERAKSWPVLHAEEEAVYKKWKKETHHGQRYSTRDPLVQEWNDAWHFWFVLPKLRTILSETTA